MYLPKVQEIRKCIVCGHLKINIFMAEQVEKITTPAVHPDPCSVCYPETLPEVEMLTGSQIRLNAFLAVSQDGS